MTSPKKFHGPFAFVLGVVCAVLCTSVFLYVFLDGQNARPHTTSDQRAALLIWALDLIPLFLIILMLRARAFGVACLAALLMFFGAFYAWKVWNGG